MLNFIDGINWHVFHKRKRSIFFHQVFLLGTGMKSPDMPFDNRVRHFSSFSDYVAIDRNEMTKLAERTVKYLKKKPAFLLEFMGKALEKHERCLQEWKKLAKMDYSEYGNEELAKALEKYVSQLLSFGDCVTLPLFVEEYLENTLMDSFIGLFKDKAQYWYSIAVNPIKEATVLLEELSLLRLAQKPHLKRDMIAKHAETFSWMKNVFYDESYYNLTYYQSRINKLQNPKKREAEIISERSEQRERFEKLLGMLNNNPYLSTLTKTANEAVFFRSYRTEIYYGSARFFTNLFKEISKRLGLSYYKDVFFLFWDEIVDLLIEGTKPDKKLLDSRRQCYVYIGGYNKKYWHLEGDSAKCIMMAFLDSNTQNPHSLKEIEGSPAYPGNVKGRVVKIFSPDEKNKVQEGDILVTHTTNVNFASILKKVGAIVTEEGGILSHASIISREMRIPCVVGTKIATKVLKDGDLVEIDADEGIVKILKRSD